MNTWTPFVIVGAIAGAFYGLHLIWQHAVKPFWRIIVALVAFSEALPILMQMAEEFKPNNGSTLRDQVDQVNIRLENIEGQLETICTESP